MTYMPQFVQSNVQLSRDTQLSLEARLLRETSKLNLCQLLAKLKPSIAESTYKARLEAELRILENNGYCGYFLIVADYVRWAKENGIAVGPGRGSGPCSLVGFALGITNIDPIKYNLPFERFVNPERDAVPDFDLDFCTHRRSEVTNYIQTKYGADHVAQISADTFSPLPSRLVICDRPLAELTQLYSNPESGFPVAKLNIAQIKNAGLVQFNVINQKVLTLIQRVTKDISKSGVEIDLDSMALDDTNAYRLLSTGDVFNFEWLDEDHYVDTLVAVQPKQFEALCAVLALSRPHLRDCIPLYVECSQRPESVRYVHAAIESITAETHGIIIYQEQVMLIAHEIAGFSLAQSDSFRRAIIKSNRTNMSNYKKSFIEGAIKFGLSKLDANSLYEHIAIAGQRYFTKAHAVSYATIAYQVAWLKANYPLEFEHVASRI